MTQDMLIYCECPRGHTFTLLASNMVQSTTRPGSTQTDAILRNMPTCPQCGSDDWEIKGSRREGKRKGGAQ